MAETCHKGSDSQPSTCRSVRSSISGCQQGRGAYRERQPFVRGRVDKNGYVTGRSSIDRDNTVLQNKLIEIQRKSSSIPAAGSSKFKPSHWETFNNHSQQHLRSSGRLFCNGMQSTEQQSNNGHHSASNSRQHINPRPASAAPSVPWNSKLSSVSTAPWVGIAGAGTVSRGVPKSLGVATCAGCGRRGYSKADGVQLKPCKDCGQVYYCSELCAKTDYTSHKALCRYYLAGTWSPAGTRPTHDYWITNRSMAAARILLRKHHQQQLQQQQQHSRPGTAPAALSAMSRSNGSNSINRGHGRKSTRQPDVFVVIHAQQQLHSNHSGPSQGLASSLAAATILDLDGRQQQLNSEGDAMWQGSYANAQQAVNLEQFKSDAGSVCSNTVGTQQLPGEAQLMHQTQSQRHEPWQRQQQRWQRQPRTQQMRSKITSAELEQQAELEQKIAAVRLHEQLEELAQEQVELCAEWGMDGPRPCLCSNGTEMAWS